MSQEARVGWFVLASVAVLAGFVFALGHFTLGGTGARVLVDFAYIGGLQIGAPVKVGGLRVGRVAQLDLLDDQATPPPALSRDALGMREISVARARLTLEDRVAPLLSRGARFAVATEGVVGETYVEITPAAAGSAESSAAATITAGPGVAVRGVDAPRLNVLLWQTATLVDSLQTWKDEAEAIIVAPDGASPTGASPTGASPTGASRGALLAAALTRVLMAVDAIVAAHQPQFEHAIDDVVATAAETRAVVRGLRLAVGANGERLARVLDAGGATAAAMQTGLPPLLRGAQEAVAAVEHAATRLQHTLDTAQVAAAVADMRAATDRLQALAAQAGALVAQVQRGDGSLGGFVNDPAVFDDIKELVADLKSHPWKVLWRE